MWSCTTDIKAKTIILFSRLIKTKKYVNMTEIQKIFTMFGREEMLSILICVNKSWYCL